MVMTLQGLTLEQFLTLPEQQPALEYFQGRVTQKGAPLGEHSALQSECVEILNRLFDPPGSRAPSPSCGLPSAARRSCRTSACTA